MKIEGIVFDLDGTLIDTLDDLMVSVNFALANYDFPARNLDEIRLICPDYWTVALVY